ncbi:uncharacterized protein LOC101462918 isoform X2 [Ceratitis capitata]|uniref:(Mediterranean fruit fly) hypothetical protein n=1 Tax=Ceratitis capitata TaxID=7213 RepID=W8AWZ8_CERCA|nr:uncharacterized protein LOC101462918 isoform X2 [Ceratitis capitata]CAD6995446.1 unnamed protein product [Ceratitis capitata]
MNEKAKVLKNVVNSQLSDLYMCSLEEYPDVELTNILDKLICSSMQSPGRKTLALRLLNGISLEGMKKNAYSWTSILIKSYAECKDSGDANQIITAIGKLAKSSHTSQDSRKLFGSNYIKNILEVITNECHVPVDHFVLLQTISILLKLYPEYSTQASGGVKNFLTKFIDSPKHDIVESSALCYHLLLNISKERSNDILAKELWSIYQRKLVDVLQTLSDIFLGNASSNVMEAVKCEPLNIPMFQLSDDPIKRYPQIFLRFKNIAIYLIVTLREPFSAVKLINSNSVIHLIKSALGNSHINQQRNKKINEIMLDLLLPQFFNVLLKILETLILSLGNHLRRSYKQIWTIFGDLLKLTTYEKNKKKTSYLRLRLKTYHVISLWCQTIGQGSRSDLISNSIMDDMLNICKSMSTTNSVATDTIMMEAIYSAQRCIFHILNSSPNNLKLYSSLVMETNVMNFFCRTCDSSLWNTYSCEYRSGLIKILFSILTARAFLKPSSVEAIINIIRQVSVSDKNIEVRNNCATILLYLENCAHPQKNSYKLNVVQRTVNNFINVAENNKLQQQNSHIYTNDGNCQKTSSEFALKEKSQPDRIAENGIKIVPQFSEASTIKSIEKANNKPTNSNDQMPEAESTSIYLEDISDDISTDEKLVANIVTTFIEDLI